MGKVMDLYAAIERNGKLLNENGLCNDVCEFLDGHGCLDHALKDDGENFSKVLQWFSPTSINTVDYPDVCDTYWGSETGKFSMSDETYSEFSSMRQTMLLFMAAINNEL